MAGTSRYARMRHMESSSLVRDPGARCHDVMQVRLQDPFCDTEQYSQSLPTYLSQPTPHSAYRQEASARDWTTTPTMSPLTAFTFSPLSYKPRDHVQASMDISNHEIETVITTHSSPSHTMTDALSPTMTRVHSRNESPTSGSHCSVSTLLACTQDLTLESVPPTPPALKGKAVSPRTHHIVPVAKLSRSMSAASTSKASALLGRLFTRDRGPSASPKLVKTPRRAVRIDSTVSDGAVYRKQSWNPTTSSSPLAITPHRLIRKVSNVSRSPVSPISDSNYDAAPAKTLTSLATSHASTNRELPFASQARTGDHISSPTTLLPFENDLNDECRPLCSAEKVYNTAKLPCNVAVEDVHELPSHRMSKYVNITQLKSDRITSERSHLRPRAHNENGFGIIHVGLDSQRRTRWHNESSTVSDEEHVPMLIPSTVSDTTVNIPSSAIRSDDDDDIWDEYNDLLDAAALRYATRQHSRADITIINDDDANIAVSTYLHGSHTSIEDDNLTGIDSDASARELKLGIPLRSAHMWSTTDERRRDDALISKKLLQSGSGLPRLVTPEHGNNENRVLVLDNAGENWAIDCALTDGHASTIYDLVPQHGVHQVLDPQAGQLPGNYKRIRHASPASPFPFPSGFFDAVVFRFPRTSPQRQLEFTMLECKRVLRAGGIFEIASMERDTITAVDDTRKPFENLGVGSHGHETFTSVNEATWHILCKIGYINLQRCVMGQPVTARTTKGGLTEVVEGSSYITCRHWNSHVKQNIVNVCDGEVDNTDHSELESCTQVRRPWLSGYAEVPAAMHGHGMLYHPELLRGCEEYGTASRLLLCHAQKPFEH